MADYGQWPASAVHTSPLYRPDAGYAYDGSEAPYYHASGLFHHGAIREELQSFYGGGASFFRDDDDDFDRDGDADDEDAIPHGFFGWWLSRVVYLVDRNAGKVKNQALVRPAHPAPGSQPPAHARSPATTLTRPTARLRLCVPCPPSSSSFSPSSCAAWAARRCLLR